MQTVTIYKTVKPIPTYDPTKTTSLRNAFAREMARRFKELSAVVWSKVVEEDFFGLNTDLVTFTKPNYDFPRSAQKIQEFMVWLEVQVNLGILNVREYEQIGSAIDKAWTNLYITDSYKRGIIRARYELIKAGYKNIPSIEATGGISVSMNVPLHMDRLGLLYTRTYSELKGVTAAMDQQISRILAQGMADGEGPRALAKKLLATINGTGMGDLGLTDTLGRFIPAARRAEMIARTEIIRAHHQALIQEYMNWAVEGVIVQAEMITAGDNRVCSKCEELAKGSPYTLPVAMNLIPVHPQCRCMCLPFEVGVDKLITRENPTL